MLDQLVESKSNVKENRTRGGYLLTTFFVVAGVLSSALVYSLFAKDLGIGNGEFELSKLITPLPIEANAPEPLKPEVKSEPSKSAKSETVVRQSNIMRIDETQPVPDSVSVVPTTQKSRPNGAFTIKADGVETGNSFSSGKANGRSGNLDRAGLSTNQPAEIETIVKTPPPLPPIKKVIAEPLEKKKLPISKGVVNGQAISLPKPPYPLAARAVNAVGLVNVQVTIDEKGTVISAKAVDGHPLLRSAAENAARNAKFKPTLLSDQPVKVTGVIVYKFATQ